MWDKTERRINGERRKEWGCTHHEAMCVKITNNENGIKAMKKILIVGIGLICSVLAYYAYAQDRNHDTLIKQTQIVTQLKSIIEYQVLPAINGK